MLQKRRGLATVVGTVFFVIVAASIITYVSHSMDLIENFSEAIGVKQTLDYERLTEEFQVVKVDTVSNKFNITLQNIGNIPVNVTRLWVENTTDTNWQMAKYNINTGIAPGATVTNIGQNIDLTALNTQSYMMKFVTSRGGAESFNVNSVTEQPLYMQLHTIPNVIPTGFPVSLVFAVANNMSNNNILFNLAPNLDVSSPQGPSAFEYVSGPIPAQYPFLAPGDLAIFEYVYTVSGVEGDSVDFGASLVNGYPIDASHVQSLNSTVTIKDTELAIESGSSLTSLGLTNLGQSSLNVLFLHNETKSTPLVGTFQMSDRNPDVGGAVLNPNNDIIIFFTNNVTAQLNLTAGIWNASLQYFSNITSPNVPSPSFAFFFECDACGGGDITAESTGNIDGSDPENAGKGGLKDEKNPVWNDPATVTDGPHADGYYTFDGTEKQRLKDDWKVENDSVYSDIGNAPDTDAVWVRIPSTSATYLPIVRYGEDKKAEDEYEIALGAQDTSAHADKIVFRYTTDGGTGQETKCVSPSSYDTNQWIHVVGVREADNDCLLYINGTLVAGPTSGSTSGAIVMKKLGIGSNFGDEKAEPSEEFNLVGDVASWIHWNSDALDQSDVTELFHTNYGKNASRIHVTVNRTNSAGVTQEVLIDHAGFELPFHDPAVNTPAAPPPDLFWSYADSNSDSWKKSSQYNYTALLSDLAYSTNRTFNINDRLSFGIKVDSDVQNIPINIQIDDINFPAATIDDVSPFLQTPPTSSAWPNYNIFSASQELQIAIFNTGPEGIWLTFAGTRLVLTAEDELSAYGAMPKEVDEGNGFEVITSTKDSLFIPDQAFLTVKFHELANPPADPAGPGDEIVVGDYNGHVFLSGYDSDGGAFVRTIDLGTIQIIP